MKKLIIELDESVIAAINEYYEGKRAAVGIDNGFKLLEAVRAGKEISGDHEK